MGKYKLNRTLKRKKSLLVVQNLIKNFFILSASILFVGIFALCSLGKIKALCGQNIGIRRLFAIIKFGIDSAILLFKKLLDYRSLRTHIVSNSINEYQ